MTIMSAILMALILAVIVEALVEYGSTIFAFFEEKAYRKGIKQLCAMLLGIAFCIAAGVDFFGEIGVTFHVPLVGIILTGIFISRGANYVSDFIKRLQSMSDTGATYFDNFVVSDTESKPYDKL